MMADGKGLFDFAPYRELLGHGAEHITSFEALNLFLDRNRQDGPAACFRRLPIAALKLGIGWRGSLRRRFQERSLKQGTCHEPAWLGLMNQRRRKMLLLSLLVTAIMFGLALQSLFSGLDGRDVMQCVYAALYLFLTFFAVYSFVRLGFGCWLALKGPARNPYHPVHRAREPDHTERCAILYPVYHEEMHRVGAGMASLIESLRHDVPDYAHHYDIFLLSDSRDERYVLTEQAAIYHLKQRFPSVVIHYRHRVHNANAKLGNVVDFLRRWGRDYGYMFMMDADSIVSGACVHQCMRMIVGNERIGIIQTNPLPVLRQSFFGRLFQFSSHLYGSVFAWSMEALSMGHASYIGHNAIIRTDAFIRHCILPELSGVRPWGGKPLSHDIAEASMMGRAGYDVWFLAGIRGSYEEIPANASGFLARENRWMQGNIQNIRFLFTDRLRGLHRETLLTGALGYVMAPVSALFMVSSVYTSAHLGSEVMEGVVPENLRMMFLVLFALAMIFVFSPRLAALAVAMRRGTACQYGGRAKLFFSFLLETLFALFHNPVIMCFVMKFLLAYVRRAPVIWTNQQRNDDPLTFGGCLREYGWCSVIGLAGAWLLDQVMDAQSDQEADMLAQYSDGLMSGDAMSVWFIPVIGGLVLAPFMAFLTSHTSKLANRCRWFLIPEEVAEPDVITRLKRNLAQMKACFPAAGSDIVRHALTDPLFYIHHYRHIRSRRAVADRLLPKIRAGQRLDRRSFMMALKERACFVELVKRDCMGRGYSL